MILVGSLQRPGGGTQYTAGPRSRTRHTPLTATGSRQSTGLSAEGAGADSEAWALTPPEYHSSSLKQEGEQEERRRGWGKLSVFEG